MSEHLLVGDYRLELLTSLRRGDVRAFLGSAKGVYVCNSPNEAWMDAHGVKLRLPNTFFKKQSIFAQMAEGSEWISPTFVEGFDLDTCDLVSGRVNHLGYGRLRGRLAQSYQAIRVFGWLIKNASKFKYCLVYNFPMPIYLGVFLGARLRGLEIVADYEDDYTLQRSSIVKNAIERVFRRTTKRGVCVNEAMTSYFTSGACVVNSFSDPVVVDGEILKPGVKLLFSGTLDSIRGADLVIQLVEALRLRAPGFRLSICGRGPLSKALSSLGLPEVEFHGLLNDETYRELIQSVDACLVLQRPDHPFSRGSFPSKVQAYLEMKKPVFVLRRHGITNPW